ncbi:MAG: DsbA family protein [Candidatus Norongarragalinales archaeon]
MICIIALIVFGMLAIFSAKYRPLAAEAFDCVFRRLTLRKCESKLDERIKATLVAKTIPHSPRLARALNKYFEVFSWILVIVTFTSLFFAAQGVYNFVVYGNCNGPEGGFCVFNPLANGTASSSLSSCSTGGPQGKLVTPPLEGGITLGSPDAPVKLVEFGCYDCPYTKQAEPTVQQLLRDYDNKIYFVFKPFPIPSHKGSKLVAQAAFCAAKQGSRAYWRYHAALFENQEKLSQGSAVLQQLAQQMGLNASALAECIQENQTVSEVNQMVEQGIASGIYGTPTFFVNEKPLVGPQPYGEFARAIEEEERKA